MWLFFVPFPANRYPFASKVEVSKHWRENITFHGLAYHKLTGGLPTLSLTTNSSWSGYLGEGCHASHQPSHFGEDRCTQFRVIVVTDPQTNKHTNRQDRLQYTAPLKLSVQCNNIIVPIRVFGAALNKPLLYFRNFYGPLVAEFLLIGVKRWKCLATLRHLRMSEKDVLRAHESNKKNFLLWTSYKPTPVP